MRNNLQNDVKIENAKIHTTKLDLSGSYSSTASIGEVSVALCRELLPGAKALCKPEQLVFLSPLVAPTYAKQYYKTWHYFVPTADVWKNYDAFMARETISRNGYIFTPTKEPCIPKDVMSALLLIGAKCTLYGKRLASNHSSDMMENVSGGYFDVPVDILSSSTNEYVKFFKAALSGANGRVYNIDSQGRPEIDLMALLDLTPNGFGGQTFWVPSGNLTEASFAREDYDIGQSAWSGYDETSVVPLDKADFVVYKLIQGAGNGLDHDFIAAFAFRMSSFGIRLFKILRGLGWGVDLDAKGETRSILRLMATYHAYWHSFGLEQWQNLESTYCGRLQTLLENTNDTDVWQDNTQAWGLFYGFIRYELGMMWVTEKNDYVSAHLPQPVIGKPNETPLHGVIDIFERTSPYDASPRASIYPGNDSSSQVSGQPSEDLADGHAYTRRIQHGALDSMILMRMYKRTNANTALGRSIAEKLRTQGLGAYLSRVRTNYIGDTTLDLRVSSVISQADTFKDASDGVAAQGAVLGERGGRGMGYRDPKDHRPLYYKTDCNGYWIGLDCVTCDSGYSQSEDLCLSNIEQEQKYQPDYDGLGLQLDPKSIVNGSRTQSFGNLVTGDARTKLSMSSQAIGFAPRYSEYKVGRSNLSGGFALPSMRLRFLGYNMDKLVYPDEFFTSDLSDIENNIPAPAGGKRFIHMLGFRASDVPTAGISYRFLGRFPWMGNLRRIFANPGVGEGYAHWLQSGNWQALAELWEYHERHEDDYILIGEFWFKSWCNVLPIEETYGTLDPERKELEFVQRC